MAPARVQPRLRAWAPLVLASIAVGLAAALPWASFLGVPALDWLGLQPEACDAGDLACTLSRPEGLLTMGLIAAAGAGYGLAAGRATGRGQPVASAAAGAVALAAVAFAGYVLVASNPILDAIHGRLGIALDELTPWIGISEAFGIAAFLAAFIVVFAVAVVSRASRPLVAAGASALVAAVAFIAVVVIVDPVLGIKLGAETIGTKAMPWTGLTGNFAAGFAGGLVGLRLLRRDTIPETEASTPEDLRAALES